METKIDYSHIRELAYEVLLVQDIDFFPLNILNINLFNEVLFIKSYQECAEVCKEIVDKFSLYGKLPDAYCIRDYKPNFHIIIYNKNTLTGRILWSLAHEIGHIVLKHKNDDDKSWDVKEKEANFFASQLLLPDCILKDLIKKGVPVTANFLSTKFGLSDEASINRIKSIKNKLETDFSSTTFDETIMFKYYSFLNNLYPKVRRYDIDEELDSQRERDCWLY